MIIFAHEAKPFTYTLKGLPRRAIIMKEYQPEIEAATRRYNAQAAPPPHTQNVPLIPL